MSTDAATNNKKFYEWLLSGRQHGMTKNAADRYNTTYEHYDMKFLGFKMNMSNIQASLLIKQLDRINIYLRKKELIAKKYDRAFSKNELIKTPKVLPHSKHARHIYTVWVNPKKRDEYLHRLQEANIGVAVNFRPIHLMTYYKNKYAFKKGIFPNAEKIGESTITIPLYPKLSNEEIEYIIRTVNKVVSS